MLVSHASSSRLCMFTLCSSYVSRCKIPEENSGCFHHLPIPAAPAYLPPPQLLMDTQAARKGSVLSPPSCLSLLCPHREITSLSKDKDIASQPLLIFYLLCCLCWISRIPSLPGPRSSCGGSYIWGKSLVFSVCLLEMHHHERGVYPWPSCVRQRMQLQTCTSLERNLRHNPPNAQVYICSYCWESRHQVIS